MEIVVVGIKKNNKQNRQDKARSCDYSYKLRSVKLFNFFINLQDVLEEFNMQKWLLHCY